MIFSRKPINVKNSAGRLGFAGAVLLLCLCARVWHSHLWGPDEPREAEIARETLAFGNWIVPELNGVPFVEKPPLYYDLAAAAYSIFPHPGSMRFISALLGCLMVMGVVLFARKYYGAMTALCSAMLCISMPQFYRAAHWILVDIGVGAFVTLALFFYWFRETEKKKTRYLALFFLFAALGFLTKGTIAAAYLGMVILPYMAYKKRKFPFPVNWTWLLFLIPVGLWVVLMYREGGIYYLHEHFVNNVFGRLLHRDLHLAGSPITVSDVGHHSPFFFYFERLPNMFGAAVVLIPFALAAAWRQLRLPFFRCTLPGPGKKIWDALTAPHDVLTPDGRDRLVWLLCWSIAPVFFLSIPAIKEVTYILPSYAGLAIFLSCYVLDRLGNPELTRNRLMTGLLPLPALLLATELAGLSLVLMFAAYGIVTAVMAYLLFRRLTARDFAGAWLLLLAGLIGGVMLGNTPALMNRTRLARKCYCELAPEVWKHAGPLPLYCPGNYEESIRGAIPFYGGRTIRLFKKKQMEKLLESPEPKAVLLQENHFRRELEKNSLFRKLAAPYRVVPLGFPEKADTYILLLSESSVFHTGR